MHNSMHTSTPSRLPMPFLCQIGSKLFLENTLFTFVSFLFGIMASLSLFPLYIYPPFMPITPAHRIAPGAGQQTHCKLDFADDPSHHPFLSSKTDRLAHSFGHILPSS